MISGLNEQLQQKLEYTLLKPDRHSWWISKMQSDTLEERYAIRLCFKLGKNATEMYGMRQTAFGAETDAYFSEDIIYIYISIYIYIYISYIYKTSKYILSKCIYFPAYS